MSPPPPQEKRCNQPLDNEEDYEPGICGPERAAEVATPIIGAYREGDPPQTEGGEVLPGLYQLSALDVWFESFELGIATVDDELSYYDALGALYIDADDQVSLDLQGIAYLTSEQGASFMREILLNFSGQLTDQPEEGGDLLTAALSCPEERGLEMRYHVNDNQLSLYLPFSDPVSGIQVMIFERITD